MAGKREEVQQQAGGDAALAHAPPPLPALLPLLRPGAHTFHPPHPAAPAARCGRRTRARCAACSPPSSAAASCAARIAGTAAPRSAAASPAATPGAPAAARLAAAVAPATCATVLCTAACRGSRPECKRAAIARLRRPCCVPRESNRQWLGRRAAPLAPLPTALPCHCATCARSYHVACAKPAGCTYYCESYQAACPDHAAAFRAEAQQQTRCAWAAQWGTDVRAGGGLAGQPHRQAALQCRSRAAAARACRRTGVMPCPFPLAASPARRLAGARPSLRTVAPRRRRSAARRWRPPPRRAARRARARRAHSCRRPPACRPPLRE